MARLRRVLCGWCYGRVTRHVRCHALLGCGLHLVRVKVRVRVRHRVRIMVRGRARVKVRGRARVRGRGRARVRVRNRARARARRSPPTVRRVVPSGMLGTVGSWRR